MFAGFRVDGRILLVFAAAMGLDMVSQERHGSIQLPSDANKGVVSSNTGGNDEAPTLVGTGVPHRQRSQDGAVLTITADRQSGVDNHRGQTERLGKESEISGRDGNRCGSERCARVRPRITLG